MKTPISGGCACGAIRYECTAEPTMMVQCHCRDCQRVTGTGGVSVGITVASLDDPSGFQTQMHTWVSDAQPWDHINPGVPKFDQYPTA